MPNWCENKLEIYVSSAEQLQAVKDKLLSVNENNELELDFNLLVPMPEELSIESSSRGTIAQELIESSNQPFTQERIEKFTRFASIELRQKISSLALQNQWTVGDFIQWLQDNPNEKEFQFNLKLGQQYIDNIKKYGCADWYDWANKNWGTKWNAYSAFVEVFEESIMIEFDTAWSPPEPWFNTLCQTFPEHHMTLSYYEPGCWFAGDLISNQHGGYDRNDVPDYQIKEFASKVFGEVFDDEDDE